MRRMQDDHSYLALYRDTAVVYAPRRSPIPGEKVRTEAREYFLLVIDFEDSNVENDNKCHPSRFFLFIVLKRYG